MRHLLQMETCSRGLVIVRGMYNIIGNGLIDEGWLSYWCTNPCTIHLYESTVNLPNYIRNFMFLYLVDCAILCTYFSNMKQYLERGVKHCLNCLQTCISKQQRKISTLGRSNHYHIVQNEKTNWTNLYIYGDGIFDWCKFGIVIYVICYTPIFQYNKMHLI